MKHFISSFLAGVCLFLSSAAHAQYAHMIWTENGPMNTATTSMIRDIYGNGYIMAGYRGLTDSAAIYHTNDIGVQDWQKTFYNNGNGILFYTLIATQDTSYIALGVKDFNGNTTDDCSAWLVKMDDTGAVIWEKTFGGPAGDFLYDIKQTADGGFIAVGKTRSNTVPGFHDESDVWVVKLDNMGDIEWQKALGGTNYDEGVSVIETAGGDYFVLGATSSDDGDVSALQGLAGNMDIWLLKLDNTGNISWEKTYGGTNDEWAGHFIINDTTIMVKGTTNSNNGNVSFNHGTTDAWIMQLDTIGTIIWEKSYGGSGLDGGGRGKIKETTPGNYTILTYASNFIAGTNGDLHCYGEGGWVFNIDNTGNLNWEWQYSGTPAGVEYNSGSYVIAGTIYPYMSNQSQYWMARMQEINVLTCDPTLDVEHVTGDDQKILVYPTITNGKINVQLPVGYEQATILLTDITGRSLALQELSSGNKREILIEGTIAGIYFLTVRSEQNVEVIKILYQP